jgi:outer membrane protein insertion porin family
MTLFTTLRLSLVLCWCGLAMAQQQPAQQPPKTIEGIEFTGARRMPQETLRAMIQSKVGAVYNEETVRGDFTALWNTRRFDDIR